MLNVSNGAVSPSGSRWLVFMTVLAVYICMIDRIAISIAIIPMAEDNGWSPTVQGAVMSAFFLGYVTLQIPAGYLSDRFGGKWVLGLGVLFWSLFTLLTPASAALGITVLLACRFLMGVAEAVTWPSIYSLYSRWVHPDRRASAVGLMNSGISGGAVIALICTPWLISVWSWQGAFYLYGLLGVLWFAVWAPLARSRPADKTDWDTADAVLATAEAGSAADQNDVSAQPVYPRLTVRGMLRSRAVWAVAVAHICINWSLYLVLSWFPTFVNRELGADLQLAGFLALAPTIVSLVMAPLAGRLFDRLVAKGHDRLKVRRVMQSLAFVGITAAMMAITLTDSLVLSVTVITLSNALTAFSIGGFATNHLDIAPNQSGLLMGVTNTLAAVSSSASVFVSGWIQDLSGGWDAVFLTAAGVSVLGAVIYGTLSGVEREFD
ncbi:MAG: putative sulfoacetate transporter SauU [Halieaceae bacterium]|nr:MAG: putative sulfoacetate transporter SauU [Halieaceae bacterium]